jgi:integrase
VRIPGLLRVVPRTRSFDGKTVFLVTGTQNGKRVQLERAVRAEADALCAKMNAEFLPTQQSIERPALTRLSEERLRDAEEAAPMLPEWATFKETVTFYNSHFRPVASLKWIDAVSRYLHRLKTEAKNEQITIDTLDFVLTAFGRDAKINTTTDLTEETVKPWIFDPRISERTQRDRYDHLNRVCRWLITEKALLRNPLQNLLRPKVESGPPTILTVPQVQKLLDTAWTDPGGPDMLPFFAICCLSGARPFEVRRAEEGHIFLPENRPAPTPEPKKKGKKAKAEPEAKPETAIFEVWKSKTPWRSCELIEPLPGILTKLKNRGLNLVYWRKRPFDRIRKDAEVFDLWDNDIQRHTFASYHYAVYHDIKWLERNMGTSERVLFDHYIRRTVRRSDAEAFFKVEPDWSKPRREFATT